MVVTIFRLAVIEDSVRAELLALAWLAAVHPSLARGLGMFGRRFRPVVTGERLTPCNADLARGRRALPLYLTRIPVRQKLREMAWAVSVEVKLLVLMGIKEKSGIPVDGTTS